MKSYTADICDKYPNAVQVLDPIFKSYGGVAMCHGEITTIELYEDNKGLVELLRDTKGDGKICVVNVVGNYCAVVGETLMGYAYHNDWAGIVINGYVRDTHQTSQIPVGLFALGTYPYKSQKKAQAKTDITLEFANGVFNVGEYLYADKDGIVITKNNIIL
ncbi:MAG: ribonuclease E activity regulator RraA [Campylobacterales bacterium]|nr:ribonuclease E activity regulator RraA [Campylobacterales bacterium]